MRFSNRLLSRRPYKEAWPAEKAIAELRRLAGAHLDPEVVAAFCDLWEGEVIQRISEEIGQADENHHGALKAAA